MGRVRIRQISGRRRTMDLRGKSGCLAPVNMGIEQRGETKWAPLASQGIPTNLGGKPKPIEFRFRWWDAYMYGSSTPLVDGKTIRDGQLLYDELEKITNDGLIVELIHEHRTMLGTLRDVDFEMGRAGQVVATVVFDPMQAQAKRDKRPSPEPERALARVQRVWGALMQTASIPATLISDRVDAVAAGVGAVNSALRKLNGVVQNYRNTGRTISALHQAFAHAALGVQKASRQLTQGVDLAPTRLIQTDDASLWLDCADMAAKVGKENRAIRQRLLQEREVMRLGTDVQIQAVHYAVEGTNLRHLAALYWGHERVDLWHQIAEFNQLEGSLLEAGASVVIPYPRTA